MSKHSEFRGLLNLCCSIASSSSKAVFKVATELNKVDSGSWVIVHKQFEMFLWTLMFFSHTDSSMDVIGGHCNCWGRLENFVQTTVQGDGMSFRKVMCTVREIVYDLHSLSYFDLSGVWNPVLLTSAQAGRQVQNVLGVKGLTKHEGRDGERKRNVSKWVRETGVGEIWICWVCCVKLQCRSGECNTALLHHKTLVEAEVISPPV